MINDNKHDTHVSEQTKDILCRSLGLFNCGLPTHDKNFTQTYGHYREIHRNNPAYNKKIRYTKSLLLLYLLPSPSYTLFNIFTCLGHHLTHSLDMLFGQSGQCKR